MIHINYETLYKSGLTDESFHTLMKIHGKYYDLITEEEVNILDTQDLVKFNKTPKNRLKAVRLNDKAKDLITKIEMVSDTRAIELTETIYETFESYGIETGNKHEALVNVGWFIQKSGFEDDEIIESVEEWLSNGYKVWMVNLFWDKKRGNIFTTVASRNLKESPLYEFMRRKYNRTW